MLAYIKGTISEKNLNSIIIESNGLGYEVFVAGDDLNKIGLKENSQLYIYEYIREQAYDLYGFLDMKTKNLFMQLLNVNGVGPKMALGVLSIGSIDRVKQSIADGDVKYLQQASGVGKRVAERIVVDLKDKIGLYSSDDATSFLQSGEDTSDEALQALMGLGYSPNEASKLLNKIDKNLSTEERIRIALKGKS